MTANPKRYVSPYVSEMLVEPDQVFDDCMASVAIMLAAERTCGEWLIQPDGDQWSVLILRNVVRKRIGDTTGGLTFHDANDIMIDLDPRMPPLPRYPGMTAKKGQSTEGATLRLNRFELKAMLQQGFAAGICGLAPNGVGHVIEASDGDDKGVRVMNPLTRHTPGWRGERYTWAELWAFTEQKKDGERAYGSADAIACAVVKVGSEMEAERTQRDADVSLRKLRSQLSDQKAQTRLATEERDAARSEAAGAEATVAELRTELAAAQARIAELEALPPADCSELQAQVVVLKDKINAATEALS